MMQALCTRCGKTSYGTNEFCDCGSRLPPAFDGPVVNAYGGIRATKLMRIGAFAIDLAVLLIIGLALGPVGLAVPFVVPFIGFLYLLFRDINGASLGKLALGCRVVGKSGGPAGKPQLILRNVTLVLGEIAGFLPIPFIGPLVGYIGSGGVSLIELISLLATGERIGDMLAATMVVKR